MVEWHPYAARTDAVKVTCIRLQCHPPPQQHRTLADADFVHGDMDSTTRYRGSGLN